MADKNNTRDGGTNRGGMVGRVSIGELYHRMRDVHTDREETPSSATVAAIPSAAVTTEDAAARSKQRRQEIWEDAKANAAYYIEQAKKDGNKKPWFQYVRKTFQYGEFILLTPDMAEELLRFNPDNRHMKPWLTAAYRRDMENDNWIPGHEGLGINLSGNMFDGQHRAEGVVEADKAVPIWIVFNVLDEAKFVTDSGAKRNVNEKLAMVCKVTLHNRTAGMLKAMMRGITPRHKFSEAEIATFAVSYQNVIEWISQYLPVARADVQAALGKAFLWYGPDKLAPFCDRLRELQFIDDEDPAKTLYKYTQQLRTGRVNNPISTYKKTLAAVDAVMSGKPCSRLYEKAEDLFEWVVDDSGNYKVPPKTVS